MLGDRQMMPGGKRKPSMGSAWAPRTCPTVPGVARVRNDPAHWHGRERVWLTRCSSPVTKIKKDLITKAKVKKQYAKIKAEHQKQATAAPTAEATEATETHNDNDSQPAPVAIHPERQAMLDGPNADNDAAAGSPTSAQHERRQRRPRKQRPDYYTKQLAAADEAKKKAEERAAEFARRQQEREKAIADRERYRKAIAKAKEPGRDGKRKVGREGKLLLDRVKKMMGET